MRLLPFVLSLWLPLGCRSCGPGDDRADPDAGTSPSEDSGASDDHEETGGGSGLPGAADGPEAEELDSDAFHVPTGARCDWTDAFETEPDEGDTGEAEGAVLLGTNYRAHAGYALAAPGDVDGDGLADLVVGAPGTSCGPDAPGAAFVVSGARLPTGPRTLSPELGAALGGMRGADGAGSALSGAGDIDGDGILDLLVGAPGAERVQSGEGATWLHLGPLSGVRPLKPADAVVYGGESSASSGEGVAGAGDLRGEGGLDLAIGAVGVGLGGVVGVVPADDPPRDLTDSDTALGPGGTHDCFGCKLSGGADGDGDGVPDLWVGAHFAQVDGVASGAAYLFLGPVRGFLGLDEADARVSGDTDGAHLGWAVLGLVDFDGDGYADPVLGAYLETANGEEGAGVAALYAGPVTGRLGLDDATATIAGEYSYNEVGTALASAGDQDGDGRPELAVGASEDGAVGLFSAPLGDLDFTDALFRIAPPRGFEWKFGAALAGGLDLGGDGLPELVVGAPQHEASTEAGAVMVHNGGSF